MLFDFKATYATLSNEALAQIVANPEGYQPDAVTAAKALLDERGITTEELHDILHSPQKEINSGGMHTIQYEDGKTNIFEDLQQRPVSEQTSKRRHFIGIAWGAVCLLNFVRMVYNYYMMLGYSSAYTPAYSLMFVNILFTLLPAWFIYQLYQRKKWGWLLSTVFMSYYVLIQLAVLFFVVTTTISSVSAYIMTFLSLPVYTASLCFLLSKQFREDFLISRKHTWWPVLAGAGMFAANFIFSVFR